MSGEAEGPEGVGWLGAQRSRLADRVRAPWWYLAGFGLAWALLVGSPFAAHFLAAGSWLVVLLGLVLFYLLQWGLDRASGVAVRSNRTLDRYPSTRPAAITMLVVGCAGIVAEFLLLDHGQLAVAVAIAVVACVVGPACQLAILRGVRRDLAGGAARG